MSRAKITAYINQDLVAATRRLAAHQGRSASDVLEDAVHRFFDATRQEGEHHALMARLDRMMARLALLEHGQETLFELTAHTTRFVMSVSPDIPEMDKADINARGSERFRNVIAAMLAKLRTGHSILRDQFGSTIEHSAPDSHVGAAAE